MKKLVLLIIIVLSSVYCHSQDVYFDKYSVEDSTRMIQSVSKNLYRQKYLAASYAITLVVTKDSLKEWSLTLCLNEGKIQIKQGRLLLLKFDDGEVMELENQTDIGPADYNYSVERYGTAYFVYPNYRITEEQIKKIASGNVIKIRVEYEGGTFDREITGLKKKSPKSKLSECIESMYNSVKSVSQKEKSIRDNF